MQKFTYLFGFFSVLASIRAVLIISSSFVSTIIEKQETKSKKFNDNKKAQSKQFHSWVRHKSYVLCYTVCQSKKKFRNQLLVNLMFPVLQDLILNLILDILFSILDLCGNQVLKSSQVETCNRLSTYFWTVLYLDLDFFCSGLLLLDREPEEVERLRLLERLFLSLSLSLSLSLLRGLSFFLFS